MLLAGLFFFTVGVFAQKTISGKVTGKNNQPIAGATVKVQGTSTATATNDDGTFTIKVPNDKSVLQISSIGYNSVTMPVNGRSQIDVSLTEVTSDLNEIVVLGYTSQKKKDITGSVAVVNVNDMKSVPGGNTAALLQGQASGVSVINSGVPGGGTSVKIRGITSPGSTAPLVIIDGVQGNLQDVNPNDIESIQVLKDAGAAAIYGVQGSNGVIIVTTKRGRQGKARISYD
ncbi:TonB-dependent receptor plug domain-containing protein, partial [Hydrotalea sp.]|uniref:TonB-dependent receptor plug domain-containing protein n=1 Tax=Hydrotalea sp. TaxID=2881279 RepID=UPI003D12A09B